METFSVPIEKEIKIGKDGNKIVVTKTLQDL